MPMETYMADSACGLALPEALAKYVTAPLPSPHFVIGSSFVPESLLGIGVEYRTRHRLCAHYAPLATCSIGDCADRRVSLLC